MGRPIYLCRSLYGASGACKNPGFCHVVPPNQVCYVDIYVVVLRLFHQQTNRGPLFVALALRGPPAHNIKIFCDDETRQQQASELFVASWTYIKRRGTILLMSLVYCFTLVPMVNGCGLLRCGRITEEKERETNRDCAVISPAHVHTAFLPGRIALARVHYYCGMWFVFCLPCRTPHIPLVPRLCPLLLVRLSPDALRPCTSLPPPHLISA